MGRINISRNRTMICCISVIVNFLLIFYITHKFGQRPFLYDVEDYWKRGAQLWESGYLAMTIDSFRGYVFPLYLGFCNHYLGGVLGWEILNSLQISAFIVFVIPSLVSNNKFESKSHIARTLIFSSIMLYLFSGLFVNPSSDIIAIECALLAQLMIEKIKKRAEKCFVNNVCLFAFGLFCYWAYNTRTIYLFAVIFLAIELMFFAWKKHGRLKIQVWALPLLGACLSSIPQIIINFREYGIVSPVVETNGLFSLQLLWGMKLQRYDTTISDVLGTARVCFVDRAGIAILQKEGITDSITYGQYFMILMKYPLEMVGLYFRHFLNMILPIYGENFITDLSKSKIVQCILCTCCAYTGCISWKRVDRGTFINFLPLLIPIVFIIPGSVEQRYGAGLYFIILSIICFEIDWKAIWITIKTNPIRHVISFCLLSGILVAIWTSTLATIEINYPPSVGIDFPIFIE